MAILSVFYSKELQNIKKIDYRTKQGSKIIIPISQSYIDKSLRRLLLSEAWYRFEMFFAKKVENKVKKSEKLSTKEIVKTYFEPNEIPIVIDFFRETRNSLHNNGIHPVTKDSIICKIHRSTYKLESGRQINFLTWSFLVDIIEEALNLIIKHELKK